MKTFKYTIAGHAVSIRLDEKEGTIADFLVDGTHPSLNEEDMPAYAAAIALALIAYDVEVVHDEEPGIITLNEQSSNWAHPSQLMTQNL